MNPYLPKLQQALADKFGVAAEDVTTTLFLLRAHYNLAGVVLCCRRLVELFDAFPWLTEAPEVSGYPTFVRTVRSIAALQDVDPHFLSGTIRSNKEKKTPLRPFSGDSALCDVLLIKAGQDTSDAQRDAYAAMQAWFAWQVIHYQAKVQSRADYLGYLHQPELEKGMVRLVQGLGSRVYGAMRLIRTLADADYAELADEVGALLRSQLIDASRALSDLLAMSLKKRGAGLEIRRFAEKTGQSTEEALRRIQQVRDLDRRVGRRAKTDDAVDLRLLSRFMEAIWCGGRSASGSRSSHIAQRLRAEQRKLRVERYGEVELVPQRVEGGIARGGILIDLNVHPRRKSGRDRDEDRPADSDPDEAPVEPELQIFVGNGDPVGAWYAGRSAAHHIEAENALLRWPRWRLSSPAITVICALITSEDQAAHPDPLADRARLLIAISLVSGRRFPAAQVALVREGDVLPEGGLAITIADRVLHVPAARPALKMTFTEDPLPAFCAPWASTLRLPLPTAWHPLLDRVNQSHDPRPQRVEREAERLLETLPETAGVSEKGIAHALKLALLDAGRDDLALVKVLTDASEANTENLIHYASYVRSDIEALWAGIVSGWAGPLAEVSLPGRIGERVGSPFGLEIDKVASAVADLKAEIRKAIAAKAWQQVHTLLVLYTSLWVGLGTAGRGTRRPIPELIHPSGWALVQDKHRPDASTDRLVPLSSDLLKQIAALRALAEAFTCVDPAFVLPEEGNDFGSALRIFVDGQPAAYQPSAWRQFERIAELPRNWARRLVRSESPELLGRFKDAGLGHWVRGRHPWSWTSTFPSGAFRQDWLALQARLESSLGFEVLKVAVLPEAAPLRLPTVSHRGGKQESPAQASTLTESEIDTLLRSCSERGEYEAVFDTAEPDREVTRWLVQKAVGRLIERAGSAVDKGNRKLPKGDIEAVCTYIQEKAKVPTFAFPPRSRFQRNWLVNEEDFARLIVLESSVLPLIERDLRALPAFVTRESSPSGLLGTSVSYEPERVRLGRLVAAVALRGDLLDTQHIDALFTELTGKKGIEAIGDIRLIELQVRSKRNPLAVRRTVLLDPYLSTLLLTEREAFGEDERKQRQRFKRHRYELWNDCFRSYLRFIGVAEPCSLTEFLRALRQRLMLESSPILAAYASGELFAHDLPPSEFRRLAGFAPVPAANDDNDEKEQGEEKQESGGKKNKAKEKKENGRGLFENDARHAEAEANIDPEDRPPGRLTGRDINLARRFAKRRGRKLKEWRRVTLDDLASMKHPAERLLGHFALYQIESQIERQSGEYSPEANDTFTSFLERSLEVVWAGLSQISGQDEVLRAIDDGGFRRLMDLTVDHFPVRPQRVAWSKFRDFLREDDGARAALAGVSVSLSNEKLDEHVSAKIFSTSEADRIIARLASVRSGIATKANRLAAQVHFSLTRAIGARRAETELLRGVDVDEDVLRIREYEGRTLKTKASVRVAPMRLLAKPLRSEIVASDGDETVLDRLVGGPVSGDNFFDQVSKTIKAVTGDADLGLHHLRHTKASLLLLRMLDNIVSVEPLSEELPWLASSLPSSEEAAILLGSAGQAGQGLKVVAALLGHLHETTTLHHYIHSLGIALYAHQRLRPAIPMPGAFRHRLPIGSTLYRYQQEFESRGLSPEAMDRHLRNRIEERLQKNWGTSSANSSPKKVIRRITRPIRLASSITEISPFALEAHRLFEHFESLQTYVTSGEGTKPEGFDEVSMALRQLALIRTGKRGSTEPRHALPFLGFDGTPLPQPLLAGLPVFYALSLIEWLLRLRSERQRDYQWLIDKWINASHARTGAMRLSKPGDLERARALAGGSGIEVVIAAIPETASRVRAGRDRHFQMTLTCRPPSESREAGEPKPGRRSAGAVRWVMTWVVTSSSAKAGQ